jgi:hypothetical protein
MISATGMEKLTYVNSKSKVNAQPCHDKERKQNGKLEREKSTVQNVVFPCHNGKVFG